MSLFLNCFLLGDQPTQVFTVEIPHTKNISMLRDLIKEKNAIRLNHVDPLNLELWKVSFPIDNIEAELAMFNPTGDQKLLQPTKKLSTFFADVADDCLHVVVKAPDAQTAVALGSTQLLSLNCYILGDQPNQFFTVEIPHTKNISMLRDLIKEKNAIRLNHVDPLNLELWKADFPTSDLPFKKPVGPMLRPEKLLSVVFPSELDISLVHIVARVPASGVPRSRPPPSAYKSPIVSADQIGRDRKMFCRQRTKQAPSAGGEPGAFSHKQDLADQYIPCNRPSDSPTALPLSLLHPIFGEYLDNADKCIPTPDDVQFSLKFAQAMANIYETEGGRQAELLRIFKDHKMYIERTMVGGYTTDGDLSNGDFKILITELKNEVGSTGAEPYFQAVLYFLEATREFATQHLNSVLPCVIMLVFGPYVAFAGAAWTDRPTVQMLSPAIPCHYQDTDIKMESMLVRHLAALRCAIRGLETYYQGYRADPPSKPLLNPTHPYPTVFTSQNEPVQCHFTYLSHLEGRNLFFGRMDDEKSTAICIKFVPYYCEEGHKFFASKGLAPTLHVVERLPGGLYMVVMDDVSDKYVSLFMMIQDNKHWLSEEHVGARNSLLEKVRQCLQEFHQAGFVHGDIRDSNIMVNQDSLRDGSFLVVDYDFCGRINQVRYPFQLNTTNVWRPEGAVGGAVIEVKHDLEMLDNIWNV